MGFQRWFFDFNLWLFCHNRSVRRTPGSDGSRLGHLRRAGSLARLAGLFLNAPDQLLEGLGQAADEDEQLLYSRSADGTHSRVAEQQGDKPILDGDGNDQHVARFASPEGQQQVVVVARRRHRPEVICPGSHHHAEHRAGAHRHTYRLHSLGCVRCADRVPTVNGLVVDHEQARVLHELTGESQDGIDHLITGLGLVAKLKSLFHGQAAAPGLLTAGALLALVLLDTAQGPLHTFGRNGRGYTLGR